MMLRHDVSDAPMPLIIALMPFPARLLIISDVMLRLRQR